MHPPRRGTPRLLLLSAAGATALATGIVAPAAADDVVAAAATHTIADVQGAADATPLAGATVTVEGVVTADHREGGYRGLYIQTAGSGGTADATPGASDGIFVFLGSRTTTAAIGDTVSVTGVAAEYFGLTQLNASAASAVVEVLGTGTLPAPVPLPDAVRGADREQYEGMLVAPEGEYRVASTHEVERFGSVWLTAGTTLPVKSTEQVRPGPDADAIAADNRARQLLLDDGRNNQVTGLTQPYLTGSDPVRTGDAAVFSGQTYVLHYGFDRWRLQPTTPLSASTSDALEPVFAELNPRPAAPDAVGGDLTVAAFNVLNYFTTLTSQDPDARGAATAEAFAIQKAKIVAAISALDADVVALQEIENSVHFGDGTPDVALADLVAGLNAAAGAEEWAYVPTPAALVGAGAPETDVIMNAVIYRTASVTPLGASATQVDETVWDIAREPIAQAFTPAGEGDPFLVVANHFKSKSGDGAEPADGQGRFNAERVEQAQAVLAMVGEVQAQTGLEDVVVLGDLNAYAQEDPIVEFTSAGWVDLVPARAAGQATYTFDGELGSLDHALATPSFAARVTGADVWDINADEWSGYQYSASYPDASHVYRASDHDPIVLGVTAGGDVAGTVEIDLLGINDFHGRIEKENPPSGVAGAAVLGGAVDAFRAENPSTLFVSGGDNIGASTFTSFVADDQPTLDVLDAIGLDVSAIGNHELDQGRVDLEDRVVPQVEFPYLAANLYDTTTGEPAFEESWVTEVDGIDVGFVGAVTAELPSLVSPTGIATIETRPVVPEVNRVVGELTDGDAANGEADVVVLLVHEGPASSAIEDATDDSVFGQIVAGVDPEVDVIFAGHTHQAHAHQIPVVGWPEGLTRPVVQSGEYGQNLAHVTLTVDAATGDVTASASEIVPLAPGGVAAFPADPEVAAIVAAAKAAADELGKASLGQITDDVMRARQNPAGTPPVADTNRGGESTLGNLVADVQLWATQDVGAEIAFMNPGGLRADLTYASSGPGDPDGNVTYREAATVQSFANTLVTMTLTGTQVVQVLEEQWQPSTASRPFLKLGVAGLTYTYDPTAAAGERITEVLVGDTPLDPNGSYRVVANSFLAGGGDNFATLGLGADKRDSGRVDLQAFVDYLAEFSPVAPDLAQRAVGVDLTAPAEGYLPGDTVTVALSSLLFSAGEPQDGAEVALSVGGQVVATAPIDPTIVDTTDEVGRATVTFTVPAGTPPGELTVTGAVAVTGTQFTFTVPVAEAPEPATCRVDYVAQPLGAGLFLSAVQVTNLTDERLRGWDLTWDYTQGERALLGLGARVDQDGTTVTATSRAVLRPDRTASFLLLGFGSPGEPTGFALDGVACATE
ncbi:ExeM/NucH family extracellular endonuclease [Actinotalea solisilvae]|uniref:ExeM/NucH family extracellular endonuclease n=1 Tax=Actinotalea solisilvae TaxID=2072922 RepID=UPI0018F22830|nr:ExeM/NucH family extracellular endonuclease [Actinotalea solisilvae]